MERTAVIRKEKGKWVVKSHDGKTLGTHPTKEKALKQLRAIEISKHKRNAAAETEILRRLERAVKRTCSEP